MSNPIEQGCERVIVAEYLQGKVANDDTNSGETGELNLINNIYELKNLNAVS
jgi:hypothetical protein